MPALALELAVSRLLSRGRLLESALHSAEPWSAIAWPATQREAGVPFPLKCTLLEDRAILHGCCPEGGFRASRIELWHGDVPVDCKDLGREYLAPFRVAFTLSMADLEMAA